MRYIYVLIAVMLVVAPAANNRVLGQVPDYPTTLSINQSFSSDTTIYPFSGQQLYGIVASGSVQLNSYTSYVRILINDSSGFQYMLFESNALLDTNWNFTFAIKCDETCYLNNFVASSITIQVQDANLTLGLLKYTEAPADGAEQLQYSAKIAVDNNKIARINSFLINKSMLWRAGTSNYSQMYYQDRMDQYCGITKYPYGFEYYIGGVFEIYGKSGNLNLPTYEINGYFDWRSRHGANESNTPYYDGDENGSGWMTDLKCQTGCWIPGGNGSGEWQCISEQECTQLNGTWIETGACTGYATISTVEGFANLYYNQHIDFDLSEQQLASEPDDPPFDNCLGVLYGGSSFDCYNIFVDHGVIGETDFPWQGVYLPCSAQQYPPDEEVSLSGFSAPIGTTFNAESLKRTLMEHGPLTWETLTPLSPHHALTLVGFDVLTVGDKFTLDDGTVIEVPPRYSALDKPIWIFKDNYGMGSRLDGYFYVILYDLPGNILYPDNSATNALTSLGYDDEDILIRDEDGDGYFNWGIGICNDCGERDGDDHNASLGPIDENGFCTIIDTYSTSFEGKGLENWRQSGEDNYDWLKHNDDVFAYGPDGAQDGDKFLLYEGSYAHLGSPGDRAILESASIDLQSECLISLNFWYFRTYNSGGTWGAPKLSVEASGDNGITWAQVWEANNAIGDESWNEANVMFFSNVNKIRFVGEFGAYPPQQNMGLDMITLTPHEQTSPLIISSDTWFTGEIFACNDIVVEPGAMLTLTSNCILHMPADHKIVVQRRGTLNVAGATITNSGNGYWEGIEIWGNNAEISKPFLYQGYARLYNGGTIANAKCAFKATKIREGSDDTQYEFSGGIVRVENGFLMNNTEAARFYPYSKDFSFSKFMNCHISIDDNYSGATSPTTMITLQLIDGLDFSNLTCTDNRTNITPTLTGIQATGAQFTVNGTNNGGIYTTSFSNLLYGIKMLATHPQNQITVDECGFYNNVRGIYTSGTTADKIVLCHFEPWQNASPFYENYGLYLDQCTGYQVEGNTFVNTQTSLRRGNGVVVNRSGSDANEVYRNVFTGLDYGIIAQNENRRRSGLTGLCIKCNDFDVCNNDIVITHGSGIETPELGIAAHQGARSDDPEDMAGNLFYIESPVPDGDFDDIYNDANHITYYVPGNAIPDFPRLKPIDYTYNTVTVVEVPDNIWNFEEGCPSYLGGGGGTGNVESDSLLTLVNEAAGHADSLQNILDALTDAGNTPQLEAEVFGSIPPETMELYTLLMNTSPWLSDTVLSTAIQKEEVLPGAMMRDIMVANPHSAKSDYLLQQLADRWEPLPDYMIAQILLGRSLISLREETEARLAVWKLKKSRAYSALVTTCLADTLNTQESHSKLYTLLESDDDLHSKYLLAFLKLQHKDIQAGAAILSGIPGEFDLSAKQQAIHQQVSAYYQLQTDTLHLLQADSIMLIQISEIMNADEGLSSVFARNVLLALDGINYTEPVILPDMQKSARADEAFHQLLKAEPPRFVRVRPNPAKDYVLLRYQVESEGDATIEVRNQQGQLMYARPNLNMQDELSLDTRQWKPGLYVVSLLCKGKHVESTKFTLIN